MPVRRLFCWDEEEILILEDIERREKPPRKLRANEIRLEKAGPQTTIYSSSNPASQGALICETDDFPEVMNTKTHECVSEYSDRLAEWDYKHFQKLCKLIGTGVLGWAYKLQGLSPRRLLEVGKSAFKRDVLPEHVRFIHTFNVSSGFSCPVITAIFKIKKITKEKTLWQRKQSEKK
jgi:hypothetical protein